MTSADYYFPEDSRAPQHKLQALYETLQFLIRLLDPSRLSYSLSLSPCSILRFVSRRVPTLIVVHTQVNPKFILEQPPSRFLT